MERKHSWVECVVFETYSFLFLLKDYIVFLYIMLILFEAVKYSTT